ncbi:MAG: zinc metallopeptidase [Oscillospiraceae bacterium]|nr:zinc metallopeptidase [Oscillospiraceae bacterium]
MNYNDSFFYANTVYILLLIPVLILTFYAQAQVKGNFHKYSGVVNRRHMTGADAARAVLQANGVFNVTVTTTPGELTDHYDPRTNTIRLSESVYNAPTIAAVGVAAHEAGHAVQYATNYGAIRLRQAIIPITQFSSKFAMLAIMLGLVLYWNSLFAIGIILFSVLTLFQLITLPVEFNASRRAVEAIGGAMLLDEEEMRGAKKVLKAAALTYVAALLSSAVQLLRFVLIFMSRSGGSRRRR